MKRLKENALLSIVNKVRFIHTLCLCSVLVLFSCSSESSSQHLDNGASFGSLSYDVDVTPQNDEPWEKERTEAFDQKAFVEFLFEKLYAEELEACDFFTEEKLSTKQLQNFEASEGFSRDLVTRVQFTENWVWRNGKLVREIDSYTIAYKVFNHLNEVRGYKPALLIKVGK